MPGEARREQVFRRYLAWVGALASLFALTELACWRALGVALFARMASVGVAYVPLGVVAPWLLRRRLGLEGALRLAAAALICVSPAVALTTPIFMAPIVVTPIIGILLGLALGADRRTRRFVLWFGAGAFVAGVLLSLGPEAAPELPDHLLTGLDAGAWIGGFVVVIVLLDTVVAQLGIANQTLEERVAQRTAALTASEAMFRAMAERQVFGMLVFGPDSKYEYINPAMERQIGYTLAELREGRGAEFVHPDDLGKARELFTRAMADDTPFEIDYRLRRKGETTYRWCVARGAVIRNADGSIAKTVVSIVDVDDRVQAEAAAQAALRAKSAFLATMSHEIRTPMNAIVGMASMLGGTRLDRQQRDHLDVIRASSDHLLAIISNILDYSKLESGRIVLETTAFEVEALIGEAMDLVAGQATAKSLALVYEPTLAPGTRVRADAGRIRQVLVNYLANAIKFTAAGEVVLRATAEPAPNGGDGAMLHFSVRDTGIGIAPEARDQLFRPFVQVGDARAQREGTGLGLAISKRLVEEMGGLAWCESEVGAGSTFHCTVHVGREPDAPDAGASGVVWIVEPVAAVRRALAARCERWAREVRAAADLTEADGWTKAGATPPDTFACSDAIPLGARELFAARWGRARLVLLARDPLAGGEAPPGWVQIGLPIKYAAFERAVAAGEPPASLRASSQIAAPPRSLRILVAEDNPVNVKVIGALLTRAGHTYVVAPDGRAAVEAVRAGGYDLVLMDVQMPELDGIAATRQICAELADARPPIVALTAGVLADERQRCLDAGMADFLTKPIRTDALAAVLAQVAAGAPYASGLAR